MKILKITAIAICLIAFSSCKDNTNRTTQDRLDDNTTTLDRTDRDDRTVTNTTTTNQGYQTSPEMTRLYTDLNMSKVQIEDYERREREHKNNMDANNAQNQTQADVDRRRDQYLKEILTNDQYQRYEQWKRDSTTRTNTNSGN
ncbi:MAG: hypothetical protein H0X63_04090 [Flavobacteriales bacterium]|nr:hypothetical protein [Flavobacteriales bacterium]